MQEGERNYFFLKTITLPYRINNKVNIIYEQGAQEPAYTRTHLPPLECNGGERGEKQERERGEVEKGGKRGKREEWKGEREGEEEQSERGLGEEGRKRE